MAMTNETEQLEAAITRLRHYGQDHTDDPNIMALFDGDATGWATQDKAEILCGRIRRQLQDWGYEIHAITSQEMIAREACVLQLNWGKMGEGKYGGRPSWTIEAHRYLLDCYIDALEWAHKQKIGES